MKNKQIAVTGIGVKLPSGKAWSDVCDSENNDENNFVPWPEECVPPYPTSKVGKIKTIEKTKYITSRTGKILNRFVIMAVNSAGDALHDAEYNTSAIDDTGCIVGTSRPEFGAYEKFTEPMIKKQISKINPLLFPLLARSSACGQICIQFGLKGYCPTIGFGQMSGVHSLIRGMEVIAFARSKRILVGGVETLSKLSLKHNRLLYDAHYAKTDKEVKAKDPLVPSEGSCFLLLEEMDTAVQRNAEIKAVLGKYHFGKMVANRDDTGSEFEKIISQVLSSEQLTWKDISVISSSISPARLAHEEIEYTALKNLCDKYNYYPELTAVKYHIGESEACANMTQVANAVQYLAGQSYIGKHQWEDYPSVKKNDGKVALVTALDNNNNYYVQIVTKK